MTTKWLNDVLDPFKYQTENNIDIPDFTTSAKVTLPTNVNITIPAPELTSTTDTWDCIIIVSPFADMYMMHIKKPTDSPIPVADQLNLVNLNNQYDDSSLWYLPRYVQSGSYTLIDFSEARVLSRSIKTNLKGVPNNNTIVTSGQLSPNIVTFGLNAYTNYPITPQIRWQLPPYTSELLIKTDPLAVQRNATLGDYNVLRPQKIPELISTRLMGTLSICDYTDITINSANWVRSTHHLLGNNDFNCGLIIYEKIAANNSLNIQLNGHISGTPNPYNMNLTSLLFPSPKLNLNVLSYVSDYCKNASHSYGFDERPKINYNLYIYKNYIIWGIILLIVLIILVIFFQIKKKL